MYRSRVCLAFCRRGLMYRAPVVGGTDRCRGRTYRFRAISRNAVKLRRPFRIAVPLSVRKRADFLRDILRCKEQVGGKGSYRLIAIARAFGQSALQDRLDGPWQV